jgi:glycopeptide antibiotics resistance protein
MKRPLVPVIILIAYCAVLIKVMVFKNMPTVDVGQLMLNFGGVYDIRQANFLPFATIVPYLLGNKGWIIAGVNLVGNVAPLVPLGFLLPLVYQNISWKRSLAVAIASGLAIETMQMVLRVGIFDVDDILLNTLGVMIGYWAFIFLAKWAHERKYIYIAVAALIFIAAVTGVFYVIDPWTRHLVNPDVGAGGQLGGPGDEP